MDEHEDKDVPVSNVVESSTVTASERVAGGDSEKTPVVESAASEVQVRSQYQDQGQGRIEGSSTESVVAEEGGSCNGVDIMVGVMGSDIYVDGVCIRDFGDGGGGNLNEEATQGHGGSIEVGFERDSKVLDVGGGVVGEMHSKGTGESSGEQSILETESEFGGSLNVTESKEEGKLVKSGSRGVEVSASGGGEGDVVDDKALLEVGVVDMEAQTVGIARGVESLVEGAAGGETQVLAGEVSVATWEESSEGGLVKEGVERDQANAAEDIDSQEVGVAENEARDQSVANVLGGSLLVVGSLIGETQVVENSDVFQEATKQAKETDGSGVDALQDSVPREKDGIETTAATSGETQVVKKSELAEEATEQVKEIDGDGLDALQDFVPMEKDGIETTAATSSAIVEDLSMETQVVQEKMLVMANSKGINPEVEAPGNDPLEVKPRSGALEGIRFHFQSDSVPTEKGGIVNSTSKVSDVQTLVSAEGKATPMDNEEITFHNTEDLHFSHQSERGVDKQATHIGQAGPLKEPETTVAEQLVKVETLNGSAKNHIDECLNSSALCQSTRAVVGDEVADAMLYSSGNDQHLKTKTADRVMETNAQDSLANEDEVLTCSPEVPEPAGKDNQSTDNIAACDHVQVDSNEGQTMEIQELVKNAQQLEGDRKRVKEQNSEAETVCAEAETDNQAMDGGETAILGNDEALNSKTILNGAAEGDQQQKAEEGLRESAARYLSETDSNAVQEMAVGGPTVDTEQVGLLEGQEMETEEDDDDIEQLMTSDTEQFGLCEGQEMEVDEQDTDTKQLRTIEEQSAKQADLNPRSLVKAHQARYELPPDDEGEFSVSDLVWGKVRSHPWWPGQIFDPSDASEKAIKYHKKDCFLVAYFGDRTFAWNEAYLLKPFRSHFSQVEKQSNLEAFQNAVDCALEEVSRRVELGLSCLCIPKDTYDEIKFQLVENTGIRQESSTREGVDKSASAELFEPDKLLEYMKSLAQSPSGGADRLELVVMKSQLLAFYRLKGYSQLPEFQFCGGFAENADMLQFEDEVIERASHAYNNDEQISSGREILQTQRGSYHKRKHNLKDSIYPRKKERSLSELMGESWDSLDEEVGSEGNANNKLLSPSSGKRRKGSDSFADDLATPEARKTISLAKVSTTTPSLPKPSFKIGECIRRVASQMTGSPSILKTCSQKLDGSNDGIVVDGSDVTFQNSQEGEVKKVIIPTEYSSLDKLLSQLNLAAQDPLKGYSFSNTITSFFSDFRNSVIIDQHDKIGAKRRKAHSVGGRSPETFEFEDMSDTYWTDRVIQNGSEEQPPHKSRKLDNLFVPVMLDQPVHKSNLDKPLHRSNSRKQYFASNYDLSTEKPDGYVDEKAPAEIVMHFPVVDSVPSEMTLNKMFRRFGPLKESQTEIDKDTNRARVVFKRCSDAEAAYGSAPKFNIFGPMLVNYQLNYTISSPFKTLPIATTHGEEVDTLFLEY